MVCLFVSLEFLGHALFWRANKTRNMKEGSELMVKLRSKGAWPWERRLAQKVVCFEDILKDVAQDRLKDVAQDRPTSESIAHRVPVLF